MNPRLLAYYNAELAYLRELGQEFAEEHPKIAARLGMNGVEVADPYVERLLQGFSFLTARIQLQMDARFPHFSERLLERLHPHYLAPTPSMGIVELRPNPKQGLLLGGFQVPRNSSLLAGVPKGEETACEFRTTHDVTLWPLEILDVSCSPAPPDLPLKSIYLERPVKGAIRLRIQCTAGNLAQLSLDQLTFYLSGADEIASRLYEAIFAHGLGVVACGVNRPVRWWEYLHPQAIRAEGFASDQALLPFDARAFQGYRLLHEYFACPQRFRFFTLTGLKACIGKAEGATIDFTILLDCPPGDLESVVDVKQLTLFCTPAINLFPHTIAAMKLSPQNHEHRIVSSANHPLDFETYAVTGVMDVDEKTGKRQEFQSIHTLMGSEDGDSGCYATRREPHFPPESARRKIRYTHYIGSEVFLSLTDGDHMPFAQSMDNLTIHTLSTNRDLAPSIPRDGPTDFEMVDSVPVQFVKILHGPTEPSVALAQGETTWRLISHLDLNYLALMDLNPADGAQALRELLSLYAPVASLAVRKHIDGLRHCALKAVTRRLPASGHILMGRGIHIDLTVDESHFAGSSPYLLGCVLEQFFPRHVGQNSFTETALHSLQRGEIGRWALRMGKRPVA